MTGKELDARKAEWLARVREAYVGFRVEEWNGFPLIKIPDAFGDTCKLLEFRPPFSVSARIYAEGMIILPVL